MLPLLVKIGNPFGAIVLGVLVIALVFYFVALGNKKKKRVAKG